MVDYVHDDVQDVAKGAGGQVNDRDQHDEHEPDRERGDGVGQRPIETGGERDLQREEEEENGDGQQGQRHRGRQDQPGDLVGGPVRRGVPPRPAVRTASTAVAAIARTMMRAVWKVKY